MIPDLDIWVVHPLVQHMCALGTALLVACLLLSFGRDRTPRP